MNTPDTEWGKWCDTLAGYSGSASNENFKAHKEATLALLTARDTYWKEVVGEIRLLIAKYAKAEDMDVAGLVNEINTLCK